ncbi:MAG: zinc ribbon domain-containing protein, partial [bacterium]
MTTTTCPRCGARTSGNFCSECGASLSRRACAHCQADLSPQARFCHRCGKPAGSGTGPGAASRSERNAWLAAGSLCVLLVGVIAYQVSSAAPEPVAPDMANTGAGTASPRPGGPAPDISQMTPRERYDRLFNRIMEASGRGDSAEVARFT